MADRTTETRNGRSEEAAAEASAAPQAKGGAASNPWLPLIITVLIMPALAFATTRFVLVPQMKKALNPAAAAAPEESSSTNSETASAGLIDGKVKQSVPMSKILVNVAGTMGTRYLMTSVTLVGNDPNLKDMIKEHNDQLLDLATSALATKTISDLEKPGSRNVIRAELMTVFNNALGGPLIKEIYITELAIQ
ncbi:MAG TPA: flagellar basal body-associated FliL family protein [Verrucomicrobiae bacterium]|jgi:flagellar FliL protein